MKRILLLSVFGLFLSVATFAQTEEAAPAADQTLGPVMEMESDVVDYGTIEKNSEPLRTLKFTNVGDEPLLIKNARGSCGCTVPTWPKEPVLPGETSVIEIRYATNRVGSFSKKVTLTTNEVESNKSVITVKGKVLKEEEVESVPASAPSLISGGNGGE
jgi:hypothetical protein